MDSTETGVITVIETWEDNPMTSNDRPRWAAISKNIPSLCKTLGSIHLVGSHHPSLLRSCQIFRPDPRSEKSSRYLLTDGRGSGGALDLGSPQNGTSSIATMILISLFWFDSERIRQHCRILHIFAYVCILLTYIYIYIAKVKPIINNSSFPAFWVFLPCLLVLPCRMPPDNLPTAALNCRCLKGKRLRRLVLMVVEGKLGIYDTLR